MSAASALKSVPDAIVAPAKTAKAHPYVVFAVLIVLTILGVAIVEARKPGTVVGGMQRLIARIPGVGRKILGA